MFFTCAKHAPSTEQGGSRKVSNGSKTLTVDIHCHCESARATEMMQAEAERTGGTALGFGTDLTRAINKRQLIDIEPKMSSLDERLADMDGMGIDVQAISVPPYQYYYWAEPEVGRQVSTILNDHLAETAAGNAERFVALGTVPLQHTEMAVRELERCVNDLGMRGVEISTNVNGRELSEPRLERFFAKAEELDVLIFIHPAGFTHADRLTENYFINLIGHPLESTLAISQLIFGGVLERHPGLKICVAHGGGYLPAYAGRMDHGYHARADCRGSLLSPPSVYLKRLYFDTMVFEPDQIAFLIGKYGADHVLLGTDYPYDMGETDPIGLIGRVATLSEEARNAVCGLNAARLLKIPDRRR